MGMSASRVHAPDCKFSVRTLTHAADIAEGSSVSSGVPPTKHNSEPSAQQAKLVSAPRCAKWSIVRQAFFLSEYTCMGGSCSSPPRSERYGNVTEQSCPPMTTGPT